MEKKIKEKVNDQLKKQGKGCPLNDIEAICDQLSAFPFSNDIKLMVPPPKFWVLKCPPYKGMNDHVAYVINFKMAWHQYMCPKKKKETSCFVIFLLILSKK